VRFFDDLKQDEIDARLGCSRCTSRVLRRAVTRMREQLGS
jgi:hypothetical protein